MEMTHEDHPSLLRAARGHGAFLSCLLHRLNRTRRAGRVRDRLQGLLISA